MYKPEEMNRILLDRFPELKNRFIEETSWQDGINTGSYVVYQDVLMPYIVECFSKNDTDAINRIIAFVEDLASSDDYEVRNLIGVTIIDNVRMYDIEDRFVSLMGPHSKILYDEWGK